MSDSQAKYVLRASLKSRAANDAAAELRSESIWDSSAASVSVVSTTLISTCGRSRKLYVRIRCVRLAMAGSLRSAGDETL